MPSHKTFSIKPIRELIDRYYNKHQISLDMFAHECRLASITNDIDPSFDTDFNLDALEFLKTQEEQSADLIFYDPPYSPRQVSECYKSLGFTVNSKTTQSSFWGNLKKEISRIIKLNGIVISFGWNSGGVGKTLGFEILEILLVPHGGAHNDTICVVERKKDLNG